MVLRYRDCQYYVCVTTLDQTPPVHLDSSVLVPGEEFADKRKVFAVWRNIHLFSLGRLPHPTTLTVIYCLIVTDCVRLSVLLPPPHPPSKPLHFPEMLIILCTLSPSSHTESEPGGQTIAGDCTGYWSRVGIRLLPLCILSSGEETRRQWGQAHTASHGNISLWKWSLPLCEQRVIG